MVTGKKRAELDNKTILRTISEYDIYRYYLGEDFPVGKIMQSPMPGRKDNHPSFLIGNRHGFYYHMDFADSRYKGNCFQFVMQKEMIGYNAVLLKIDRDFNLGIATQMTEVNVPVFIQPKVEDTKETFFQVHYSSKFTNEELKYWEQFYITPKELKDNEIYAVRKYLIDRRVQPMKLGELTFGYREGSLWKIYKPFACKRRKWKTNIPLSLVENLVALKNSEIGIVTKARKDRVVLLKFLKQVANTQNESLAAFTPETAAFLYDECENPYVNYDADEPGKQNSIVVTQKYSFKHLNVPDSYIEEGIKDFADLIKMYGPETVHKYLQSKNIVP